MNPVELDAEEFLKHQGPLVDVRSESEYCKGHIPGAISLPLLKDEVRHRVGIVYAQEGRRKAVEEGLKLTSGYLSRLAVQMTEIAHSGALRMYCWRGGMRSQSAAFLARLLGIPVVLLKGGYKAFRRHVHHTFDLPWKLIVLGGMTGSGKTDLLRILSQAGEQVLDLEALASHKGSVFGHLLQNPQPTTEHFENLIFQSLSSFDPSRPVWVEDESISIGSCFIPKALFTRMQEAPMILLNVDRHQRAKNLAQEYGKASRDELIASVNKIKRRLGLEKASIICHLIELGNLEDAALLLLEYYDKAYNICILRRDPSRIQYLNAEHYNSTPHIIKRLQVITHPML